MRFEAADADTFASARAASSAEISTPNPDPVSAHTAVRKRPSPQPISQTTSSAVTGPKSSTAIDMASSDVGLKGARVGPASWLLLAMLLCTGRKLLCEDRHCGSPQNYQRAHSPLFSHRRTVQSTHGFADARNSHTALFAARGVWSAGVAVPHPRVGEAPWHSRSTASGRAALMIL